MSSDLTVAAVFFAGVASFLSPCVVPLMPVYLSYLTGSAVDESMEKEQGVRKKILVHSIGFLLGLVFVFSLLGLTATALGQFLVMHLKMFRQASGALLVIFGLYHGGFIKIPWFDQERKLRIKARKPGFLQSVLIGMVFSFGWTPCIGTILGSILVVAANTLTLKMGVLYLAVYSLGFSIPFLVTALFWGEILKRLENQQGVFVGIKKITGIVIALVGIMILFGWYQRVLLVL